MLSSQHDSQNYTVGESMIELKDRDIEAIKGNCSYLETQEDEELEKIPPKPVIQPTGSD